MATSIAHLTSKIFCQQNKLIYLICVRGSRYDKSYVENFKTLDDIQKPLDQLDPRRFSKIKAAKTDDLVFTDSDPFVQKFINMVMESGRKDKARDLVFKALVDVKRYQVEKYHKTENSEKREEIDLDPFVVFHKAIENGRPRMHLQKVVRGGQSLQVPVPCSEKKSVFFSMKWLILVSQNKARNRRFHDQLASEIIGAYYHGGGLIRKKQEMHKLCEANKAFAHFA